MTLLSILLNIYIQQKSKKMFCLGAEGNALMVKWNFRVCKMFVPWVSITLSKLSKLIKIAATSPKKDVGGGKNYFLQDNPKTLLFLILKKSKPFQSITSYHPKLHIEYPHQCKLVKVQISTLLQFADCYPKEPARLLKKSNTFLRKRAELSSWLW